MHGYRAVLQLFGMTEPERPPPTPAALEAGHKLASNHEAVLNDILKNAGLLQSDTAAVRGAAEAAIFNLAAELSGQPRVPPPEDADEAKAAKAVTAAVLAFLRSRVSAPRDMSGEAAEAFRDAADRLLTRVYWR